MKNHIKLTGSVILLMALVFAFSGCPGGGGGGPDGNPSAIKSFQVDGYRDEFLLGENFTLQNLVLNVVFDDGEVKTYTEADLPNGFSLNLSDYNKNEVGTYCVILQYKGFDLPLELTVTVIDPNAKVQKPMATPSGGTFTDGDTITLVCGTDGAEIRYTVNGAEPIYITDGAKYTAPISLSGTGMQVIRARSFDTDTIKSRDSSELLTAWYASAEGAKAVFVGGQSSALTAGAAGVIEIPVFTIGIDADTTGTIAWYTDPEGTEEGGIPVYINPVVTPVSAFGGSVSFTANRLGGVSVEGTYYYRVTYDGTESDVGNLVISPATGGTITVDPIPYLYLTEGYLPGSSLAVSAAVDEGGTLSYQWYSSTEFVVYAWASTLLEGETDETLSILPGLAAATDSDPQIKYYFCMVSAEGSESKISAMTRVYVYPRRSIVSVVEESGRIISGSTTNSVEYTVTTTGFPNAFYPITMENLPTGVSIPSSQSGGISLAGNTGTLRLVGSSSTPPEGGVYSNLRLSITGTGDIPDTESPFFDLTVYKVTVGTQIGSLTTAGGTLELPVTARGFANGTYDVIFPLALPYNLTSPSTLEIADETGILILTSSGYTGSTSNMAAHFTLGTNGVQTPNFPLTFNPPGTVLVSGITIDPPSEVTVVAGETAKLTATVAPSNASDKTVTWSSSSTAIATVNNDGTVVGVSAGSVTIRATAADGSKKNTSKIVTVQAAPVLVNSITISPATLTVAEGTYADSNLTATVLPANATNKTVTWSSSDDSIATVTSLSGRVSGISRGIAIIRATANDGSGWFAECRVTVRGPAPTSISFSKDIIYTWYGKEENLGMYVYPANADRDNIEFTWRSDDWAFTDSNMLNREGTGKAAIMISTLQPTVSRPLNFSKITLTATLPNGESASIEFRTRFVMWITANDVSDPLYFYKPFNDGESYSWPKNATKRYVRAYYPANASAWESSHFTDPDKYLTKIPRTQYTISSRDPDIVVTEHPSDEYTYVLTRTSASVFKMVKLDISSGTGYYPMRYSPQVINLVD